MKNTLKELYIYDGDTFLDLGILDDFKSVVWNNKYYSCGDFEFIVPITERNLSLVQRNRFVSRNDVEEIGIVEDVSIYDKDGEKGIKATGSFAQSLLGRRIIWNKLLLNGLTLPMLRGLIDNNILNPSDWRRKIPTPILEKIKVGNEIDGESGWECFIQSVSGNAVVEHYKQGFTDKNVVKIEQNIKIISENESATISIGEMLRNPRSNTIDSIEYNESAENWQKIKRVGYTSNVEAYFAQQIFNLNFSYSVKKSYNHVEAGATVNTPFNNTTFFEDYDTIPQDFNLIGEDISYAYKFDASGNIDLTTNKLEVSCPYGSKTIDNPSEKEIVMASILPNAEVTFYFYERDESKLYGHFSKTTGFALFDITPSISTIDLSALPRNATKYKLMNNEEMSLGVMSMTFQQPSEYNQYLELGNYPTENISSIYEIVDGNNLQEYIESVLQSINLGLKARFVKQTKKIYLDFYAGENKTLSNGKLRPVLFSKSMDALNGYEITESSKSKINVLRVIAKNGDGEITVSVGGGSGLSRNESTQSISNYSTYSGADYLKDLSSKGEIFLNGFELVMDADIYSNAYEYRNHYNVGDLCTIFIDEFNMSYDIRILEVCESYDTNGYQITLVLGV